MEIIRLSIEGNRTDILPQLLVEKLPHCHVCSNGNFHVLVNEKHYIRSEGLIMTTIVIDLCKRDVANIEIVAGGGGEGLFDLDWHVEKHRTKHIIQLLNDFCQLEGWWMGPVKKKVIEEFE